MSAYVPKPEIALDPSGNIYVVYVNTTPLVTTNGQTNVGGLDICVVKFDTNGNMLWYQQQPSFDTSLDDIEPDLAVNSHGNVYVAYCTGGVASGQSSDGLTDIVVFKLDTNGNTLWVIQNPEFTPSVVIIHPRLPWIVMMMSMLPIGRMIRRLRRLITTLLSYLS